MATDRADPPAAWLCIAGLLSLAVAMGIGRFAFTPVLPLMLREGRLDVPAAGWVAAANYLGYLAGALAAARWRLGARALGIAGLLGTAALTAAMALPGVWLWAVLRFGAGVASAWVFVATSVWCLGALARAGRGAWSGVVYAGVGSGIALAGLYTWAASSQAVASPALWLQLGALALVLAIPVLVTLTRPLREAAPSAASLQAASTGVPLRGLVLCYGLMGFGYILPATFLPAMARTLVDDPRVFGLAWPVFGATAALSTVLSAAWMRRRPRLEVWAVCQAAMALGALLPSLWLTTATIVLSALLVGGTFMVITLAGVQEVRARAADGGAGVARMTAAFATGQIAGPVASALLLYLPALRTRGLDIALQLAALGLALSAAWLWRAARTPSTNDQEIPHAA